MFPGWETLPFERVSPSVETMGQRLEVLWRLHRGDRAPKIIVAGVRSLLQKAGTRGDHSRADRGPARYRDRPGGTGQTTRRVRLPARRTRRTPRRVRPRGAPSSMCTRPAPMPRSASTCGATRSTDSHASASTTNARRRPRRGAIFPARELIPTDECANRLPA